MYFCLVSDDGLIVINAFTLQKSGIAVFFSTLMFDQYFSDSHTLDLYDIRVKSHEFSEL